MQNVIRTVYGSALQTNLLLGLPIVMPAFSTLNKKLNINATTVIASTDKPVMKYVAIGNGGHTAVAGSDGIFKPEPVQHRTTDAALYNQLPYILRAVGNDINATDRAKYALRKIITVGSSSYIAYYLKRLDLSSLVTNTLYNQVANGITTTSTFTPSSSNLNPTPPNLSNNTVLQTSADYVNASAILPFIMNAAEAAELSNVANILYGDTGYAIISEVALCSGVDKVFTTESAFNFNDAIGVQVMSFINTFFAINFSNSGVDVEFDCGATEPLFLLGGL